MFGFCKLFYRFDTGMIANPSYQKKYGTGYKGQYRVGNSTDEFWGAWGPELDGRLLAQWNSPYDENGKRIAIPWIPRGKDNLDNMLRTGVVTNNNVSVETKSQKGVPYFFESDASERSI